MNFVQAARGNNTTTGFDYLRLGLSIAVVCWHSIITSYGPDAAQKAWNSLPGTAAVFILPMFFSLSGYLVSGSLSRNSVPAFLTLRVVRIVPALFVEILLSAFLLGPILTKMPIGEYFSSRTFFEYLLNIIGYIHYQLPGVFLDNPRAGVVNASLWTIPFELECYIAITLIGITKLFRRPNILAFALIFFTVLALYFSKNSVDSNAPGVLNGRILVISFLFGVLIYSARDIIPCDGRLALLSAVLAAFLFQFRETAYLATIPAAYLTVWIGTTNPRRLPIVFNGDYSYGIYLFAYPIQQTIAMIPELRHWWINIPLALTFSGLYAAFSWHFIEKPVLVRKNIAVAFVSDFETLVRVSLRRLAGGR